MKRSFSVTYIPVLAIACLVIFFFRGFFLQGLLPIPSDTIVGLYHPFRDVFAKQYPNGIPFKNFLITDPVRQQYPWRQLAVSLEKRFNLPLWNPYNGAGTPLLGNFQSAALYPFNILFFFLPFSVGWTMLVVLQPLLGGLFLYFYLRQLSISVWSSIFGATVFVFSGFSIAWLEWNTILHVAIWLPLLLLSIDKIFTSFQQFTNQKKQVKQKSYFIWVSILLFSFVSSFFAGHLQTFFYLYIVSIVYFISRWFQLGKQKNILVLFFVLNVIFIALTSMQWLPTLQFILDSARTIDQANWQQEGWFIPFANLIQFVAPDFFGNPTTLNYWGVWNYAEFIGYIGIFPLISALYALFFRHDKKTLFFGTILFLSLVFSLPTPIAKIPYILNIPFLSTSQPTRLLFLIDFSLAILSAFGIDLLLKKRKEIIYPIIFLAIIFSLLWLSIFYRGMGIEVLEKNLQVAKANLILPTGTFLIVIFLLILLVIKKNYKFSIGVLFLLFGITVFDLLRFGQKFTPFTEKSYLFPSAKTIAFLQDQPGTFRILTTDDRVLPPNFSAIYRLQSVDIYDPLYLRRFGELIVASERKKPDIAPPFGFNRIITPHGYDSKIIDLLGVKYVLSLTDIDSSKLKKVFQEGETRVYENKDVLPRIFFVENIEQIPYIDKQKAIEKIFDKNVNLKTTAVVEFNHPAAVSDKAVYSKQSTGSAEITFYQENKIIIKTENQGDGFLVLTDSFYPAWSASVDGIKTTIYRTDYNFRGIFIPKGSHTVQFLIALL